MKLFQPGSRWTYYVCAASEYEGIEGPVLTGYCVSPLGPDCDEFGETRHSPRSPGYGVCGLPPVQALEVVRELARERKQLTVDEGWAHVAGAAA